MKLYLVAALMIAWSAEASAWECMPPPETPKDYEAKAHQIAINAATIVDAIVERPYDAREGRGEILRALHVWKGPKTERFQLDNDATFDPAGGRRGIVSRDTARFRRAGERVRLVLYNGFMRDTYRASWCTQALLDDPKMLAALARQLGQPALVEPFKD